MLQSAGTGKAGGTVDDRKLEVLIAAVETGSFNKAAVRCHCTQSAVTQLVNAIESELGCKLVERSHAGVRLTEAGAALMPQVKSAHEALCQLKATAEGMVRENTRLRIGAYASIASSWLPDAVAAFGWEHPEAYVEIRIGSSNLAALLRAGDIDMALCDDWLFEAEFAKAGDWDFRDPAQNDGKREVRWVHLMDDALLAVVPTSLGYETGQTIARADLFMNPYIFNSDYLFAHYLTSRVSSLVKVNTDDSSTILSMVAAGMGVSVLPGLSLSHVQEGISVLALDPPGRQMLGIALPSDAGGLALKFVRHLEGRFADTHASK